jgi:tRNA modification GTPase
MTGEGVGKLVTALTAFAGSSFSPVGAVGHVGAVGAVGTAIITRERHRQALTRTAEALGLARRDLAPEILAEHLRQAATELGRITGRVDVEDVLGRIFSEFCVGK